ncbi:MAG TPA: cupin domain-containing protein [Panacibacter sp.]|nr:cupin domain-containing protein [Panacibacter sp.]
MDLQAYIKSGIIEDYCLGVLGAEDSKKVAQLALDFPEIKQEVDSFTEALGQYAADTALFSASNAKHKIFSTITNLRTEETANAQQLPLLNKYSEHINWLKIVKPMLPEKLHKPTLVRSLRNDDSVSQLLIWTTVDFPEEIHNNEQECFIILEGRCRCQIGDQIIEMGPGDFLEVPMHKHHDVQILEPVLALVQRIKAA